jgi:flagellar hook-basal body complex protein FliE
MSIDYNDFRIRGVSEGVDSGLSSEKTGDAAKGEFKSMLSDLIGEVDSLQKNADQSIKGLVDGDAANVHDVMIQLEEAGVAFELMMEIRNKLVDAYQQILRMQS